MMSWCMKQTAAILLLTTAVSAWADCGEGALEGDWTVFYRDNGYPTSVLAPLCDGFEGQEVEVRGRGRGRKQSAPEERVRMGANMLEVEPVPVPLDLPDEPRI